MVVLVAVIPSTWSLDVGGHHRSMETRVISVPWSLGLGIRPKRKIAALPMEQPDKSMETINLALKPECFPPCLESSEVQNMKAYSPSNQHHTSVSFIWPTPANAMSPTSQPLSKQSSSASPTAATNAGQEYSWMCIVVQNEHDAVPKSPPSTPPPSLTVVPSPDLTVPTVRRRRPAAWSLGLGLSPPPPPPAPQIIHGGPSSMRAPLPPTPPLCDTLLP